jgi:hypothetical protein
LLLNGLARDTQETRGVRLVAVRDHQSLLHQRLAHERHHGLQVVATDERREQFLQRTLSLAARVRGSDQWFHTGEV